MTRWICPRCDREFGRANQSHVCVPGCTVDDCFAGRPAYQREIYDRLVAYVATLGPYHADVVSIGVFLKHQRTFVEVRPKARALSLELVLPDRRDDPRFARVLPVSAGRLVHTVKLTSLDEYDDQLREWLTEAYDAAGF
ncbi:MAG: DUF5655 domain-containing protein [Micromonosporaceae bacterium]